MDVVHDNQPLDVVKYITTQLSQDLLNLIAVRDELAKRQGAMSAVEDASNLRTAAAAALESAKTDSAEMLALARAELAMAKVKSSALNAQELELNARETAFDDASAQTANNQDLTARLLVSREISATERETRLEAGEAALASAQKTLAARIAVFQEKVAALTA
jgi:hypothetical protein